MTSLDELSNQQRRALLASDTALLRTIVADWRGVEAAIDQEIARLLAQAPDPMPPTWLYERSRLGILRIAIQLHVQHFADRLAGRLAIAQQEAAAQGALDAVALLEAAGIAPIITAVDALLSSPTLALSLSKMSAQTAQAVTDALIRGMATGQHPRQIARLVKQAGMPTLRQALTLSRTEPLRAYREATRQGYLRNQDVVTGWVWHAHLGPRTCAVCIALHGTVFKLEQEMKTHPNCRCTMIPLVVGVEIGITGPAWFAQQSTAVQRNILGPGKLTLYKAGQLELSDLVGETALGRYELPLKELAA